MDKYYDGAMRVVFYSKYIPKRGDGASTYLLALIRYFKQAGFAVEWLCLNVCQPIRPIPAFSAAGTSQWF